MTTCPFTKQECSSDCALLFHNPYDDKTSCSLHALAVSSTEITEIVREMNENLG